MATHSGGVVDLGGGKYAQAAITARPDGSLARGAAWLVTIPTTGYTAATPVTLRTPAAGLRCRILGWQLGVGSAGSLIVRYGAGNVEAFRIGPLGVNGKADTPPGWGDGFLFGAPGDDLKLECTVSGTVTGILFGLDE